MPFPLESDSGSAACMRVPFPLDSMPDRAACAARAGCHSDSGFAHTERNFYAQMIYGESFEFGNQSSWHYIYPAWDPSPTAATLGGLKWNSAVDATAKATIGYDQAEAHHGYASLKLDYTSGSGTAGVTNRGIGNEGLFLKSGLEYEGYFFAKSSKPAKMVVMLRNWETKAVLGTQEIAVAASSNWTKYPFTMTASNGTTCEGIKPGSNPEVSCNTQRKGMAVPPDTEQGHVCIKCGGEFVIALSEPATVHVDYVYLQPGPAGRYGAGPFFKDGVQVSLGPKAATSGKFCGPGRRSECRSTLVLTETGVPMHSLCVRF